MTKAAYVGLLIGAVCMWIGAYCFGRDAGVDEGRRLQAKLTPVVCRDMEKIAGEALDNSQQAARGWAECEVNRTLLLHALRACAPTDGGTP
jgi:hypothetical protein